jgi:hypothetical protein
VDLHCFDADPEPNPDPAQNLDADPVPDPGPGRGGGVGREGVGQPKMCIPPGKILGTPLPGGPSTHGSGHGTLFATYLPYDVPLASNVR